MNTIIYAANKRKLKGVNTATTSPKLTVVTNFNVYTDSFGYTLTLARLSEQYEENSNTGVVTTFGIDIRNCEGITMFSFIVKLMNVLILSRAGDKSIRSI